MKAHITKVMEDVFSCDDCGAWAKHPDEIVHHPTCEPGSSERWARHYDEAAEDGEA